MNLKLKIFLYVVLVGAFAALAAGFYATLHGVDARGAWAAATSGSGTNAGPATNANSQVAGATNAVTAEAEDGAPAQRSSPRTGRLTAYGVAMFFTFIALALLIAGDLSRYFANRVDEFIFNDNLEGVKDPEYDEAEQVWARGQHLEAIQLMRDYLKRHPREQYVALRIAEIYEGDLRNYLAAALEYQEVLKKRLPPERWGWAAIHLANLYSGRLNKHEEATALLRRIVEEYGQTAAAKKARERLGLPEPVAAPVAVPVPPPVEPPKSETPPSNLPRGFRPK